jgi:UPF0176 protein
MLHNKFNRKELLERLENEDFKRLTISFYRYIQINNPDEFRNQLYSEWFDLNCFGRVYIAAEGINAQMSIPEFNMDLFLETLKKINELNSVQIKYAIEDNGKSFYKLTIKVKQKVVADGLDDNSYDISKVGNHLSPIDFHNLIDDPECIVIDMRNRYESEVGRFSKAFVPEAATFKDAIKIVSETFGNEKNKTVLLYCTGGIRCEKASSFLIQQGFKNVNQLNGGIINYAHFIKSENIASKFIGKNFVFDERLGESIDGQIISNCHQCGKACDTHTNCANTDCHMLFIQCKECAEIYDGCCSVDCKNILPLPLEEKKKLRVANAVKYANSKIFNTIKKYSLYNTSL